MSGENETNKCKQRFKGVENFLRRVAFNLGNTPSQTEVKIISCIPIDVTDLQQKIIQLEQQLEDAKTTKIKEETKTIKNARCAKSVKVANGCQKHMDKTKDTDEIKLTDGAKQANGPNQQPNGTKQPDAARPSDGNQNADATQKRASAIHTTLCKSTFPKFSSDGLSKTMECCQSNHTVQCDDYSSSKNKKSAVSFIFPIEPTIAENYTHLSTEQSNKREEKCCSPDEWRRNIFRMKKMQSRKKKIKTQLVYYAQASNTPFNSYEISTKSTFRDNLSDANSNLISRSYLSDMIRKQYKPVTNQLSDTSQFSSPVCRDVEQPCLEPCSYESDVCSCCHGRFQDIDHYITRKCNPVLNCTLNVKDKRNSYYDSSLYDVIPVKENTIKAKKEVDAHKRKELKVDIGCWPEHLRAKSRYYPMMVNYNKVIPASDNYIMKNTPTKVVLKRNIVNKITAKRVRNINKLDQQTGMESSKSCSVDFSACYSKEIPKFKTVKKNEIIRTSFKNAVCLTSVVNNTDCQTTMPNKEENKTGDTLNRIKSILQLVLTEVKTNSQLKYIEDNTKKDAVVQKDASQSNMQKGSSLMNSFTYSPYNINPHGPTCSKQMASNHICYYGLSNPMNTMHNYPLLIQNPGRHKCSSCFRNSQYKAHIKTATTVATNTEEINEQRNKETEKLIKEIYKSIALDIPTKEKSQGDYYDLISVINSTKKISDQSKQESEDKEIKVVISEIFRNTDVQNDTSLTRETDTTIRSNFILNTVSSRSQSISTDLEINRSKNKINKTFENKKNNQQKTETDSEPDDVERYPAQSTNGTTESSDSETSSSEIESDDTFIPLKEPKENKRKKGLFGKVFQLFHKNKKKVIDEETELEESETSESDDYQTIYSQKTEIPRRTELPPRKHRPHTKILHSKPINHTKRRPDRFKRIPYMEQEYRRYWNEKLMFHDKGRNYSSEQTFSKETIQQIRQQPVYCQNYEARSVLVESPTTLHQRLGPVNDRVWNRNELESANGNTRQTINVISPPAVNLSAYPAVNVHRPLAMSSDVRNGSRPRNFSPMINYETRNRFGPQNVHSTDKKYENREASYDLRNRLGPPNVPPAMNNRNHDGQRNISVGKDNSLIEKKALKRLFCLKNLKLGTHCGEKWKKFILEN